MIQLLATFQQSRPKTFALQVDNTAACGLAAGQCNGEMVVVGGRGHGHTLARVLSGRTKSGCACPPSHLY